MLLHEEGHVVPYLRKAIRNVLGQRLHTWLEPQSNPGPIELRGVEILPRPRDGEVQTVSRWEHPIACIEPERPCFASFYRDTHIQQVSRRPQRILDLDIERK